MNPYLQDPTTIIERHRNGIEHEEYRRSLTPALSSVATLKDNPWCKLIAENIDVEPMLEEVKARVKMFNTLRDRYEVGRDTFSGTDKVYLRHAVGPGYPRGETLDFSDSQYLTNSFFAKSMTFARNLAGSDELGFVLINRMRPHAHIKPHFDRGLVYIFYDRYHLILETEGTVVTGPDGDVKIWKKGELWWFNHRNRHSVDNPHDTDRYHLLIDVMPEKNKQLKEKLRLHSEYYS